MDGSNTTAYAGSYAKWRDTPAWRLLAADHAPMIISVLQHHLLERDRTLPAAVFCERLSRDLEQLRAEGWDLPQTAPLYIAQWLASGYLERTLPQGATEEIYELTVPAIKAIRFVNSLHEKRQAATESRLSLVIQQLSQLASQTESNPKQRLAELLTQRRKIDAQIKQARAGKVETIDEARALERVDEITLLSDELVHDFRQVRDNFSRLNQDLREKIMSDDANRGIILGKLFAGVDIVVNSDSGRTFSAFWQLLTDPEQSMILETSTTEVLSRGFMKKVPRNKRLFLTGLTRVLLEQGGAVHEVLQYFARSLKHFVESRAFQEQRRLNQWLRKAQKQALQLKNQVQPTTVILSDFSLTGCQVKSLSQLRLYDPSLYQITPQSMIPQEANLSLSAIQCWVSLSEIDFRALTQHIYQLLANADRLSIADILAHFPAKQGLGTVVGYLSLGLKYGVVDKQAQEHITWVGEDSVHRSATIGRIYFLQEKRHVFRRTH